MAIHDLKKVMGKPEYRYPGMQGSTRSLEWLWNSHFAAVAADSPGFEAWSAGLGDSTQFRMHEVILPGFGLPIGELFDLKHCPRNVSHTIVGHFLSPVNH